VHRNGKLIFWGAKSLDDIDTAFEIMRREMRLYEFVRKGDRIDCSDHELTTF
jgi:TATA-box binding protein (TBP) (component of TFIID and TFIIIB)